MPNIPTKEEALKYVRSLAAENIITKNELDTAFAAGSSETKNKDSVIIAKKLNLMEVLCYIGGAIVFLGIIIILTQHWQKLNSVTKILVTFGAGIAAYITGLMFSNDEKTFAVSSAFYLISALLLPTGIYVIFDLAGFNLNSSGLESFISMMLFIAYFSSYFLFRKNIFLLFSVIFATWFYYAFLGLIISEGVIQDKIFEYCTLAAGLAYIFLGFAFSHDEKKSLSGFLYSFGILGFLGAAFALGGYEPKQDLMWELIFPCLAFAALFFSVQIKSKAFLTFGTLFLIIYIAKITAEYFSKTLSWPFALVIAGLAIIGVGYLSFRIKNT
ncbi:MAG: DUF2157 domain-containing protein [Gammaproteobacteria bacterium]|nr:DUF2157 domain-containing protein [Gammaproteobacteria bacterium]